VRDNTQHYYYALYYTTQAAFQAGDPAWAAVWKITASSFWRRRRRMEAGRPSRMFRERSEECEDLRDAMSVLTLSVPLRVLPIYQR